MACYLRLHQNVNGVFFSNHSQGTAVSNSTTVAGLIATEPILNLLSSPLSCSKAHSRATLGKRQDHSPAACSRIRKRLHQLVRSRNISKGEKKIQGAILFCPGESLQVIILMPVLMPPKGCLASQILKGQIKRILHFRVFPRTPEEACTVDERWQVNGRGREVKSINNATRKYGY